MKSSKFYPLERLNVSVLAIGMAVFVVLSLDSDSWDLVDAPYLTAEAVEEVKRKTVGLKYDLVGAVGVVILSPDRPHKWFCSELAAEVIGLKEPWRFSPNTLYSVVQRLEKDNG